MTQQTTTPLGARSTSTGQVLASLLHFLVPLAAVSGICIAAVIGIAAIKDVTTFELFPTDRVLDVQITVAEKDWNKIRFQSRNFFEALQEKRKYEPIEPPYVYVTARVTVDGVEFPQVGIRKKGFIGSQNPNRPSLKIKLNHIDEKAELGGQSMLTFNNNNQDITLMSQFMGYALFNAAGAHRGVATPGSASTANRSDSTHTWNRSANPCSNADFKMIAGRSLKAPWSISTKAGKTALRRNSAGSGWRQLPATRSRP